MKVTAREMQLSEVALVIDYFHHATPEHLEMMGVDPSRMPRRAEWFERYTQEYALPIERRTNFLVIWLSGDDPVGFSTCNPVVYGDRANMHLHVTVPENRHQGIGAECVRQSVDIYFDRLKLEHLFCEPNAFNVAPNRTLHKVGFKYLKTHMTVPGTINYHQAVTRWVMERMDWSRG
jgi:RimJ/RimL family protein N-acetyltransferase